LRLPQFTPADLTRLRDAFDSDEYLFELKMDGFRAGAYVCTEGLSNWPRRYTSNWTAKPCLMVRSFVWARKADRSSFESRVLKPTDSRNHVITTHHIGSAEMQLSMTNIFVGNLPYEVTEEDLQLAFGQYGAVESVNVVRHRGTGKSRGFAFVEMTDNAEAANAINWAVDRRERSASSP
jgi:hypothetical protein